MFVGKTQSSEQVYRTQNNTASKRWRLIPVILEDSGLLAAFTRWNASPARRIDCYVYGSDWRSSLAQLPPTRIINDFGYVSGLTG
jgi:hypothetical protein